MREIERCIAVAAAIALCISTAAKAGDNYLQNGTFDFDTSGWVLLEAAPH